MYTSVYNFSMKRGDTSSLYIGLYDEDGNPITVGGISYRAWIVTDPSSPDTTHVDDFSISTASSLGTNFLKLSIDSDSFTSTNVGTYYYDFEFNAGGTPAVVHTPLEGTITVVQDITQ